MAVHALRGGVDASDGSDTDSDDDVLFGVVVGSGRGVASGGGAADDGFHSREARVSPWRGACVIRAPCDSDDSDDSDDANDVGERDDDARRCGVPRARGDGLGEDDARRDRDRARKRG